MEENNLVYLSFNYYDKQTKKYKKYYKDKYILVLDDLNILDDIEEKNEPNFYLKNIKNDKIVMKGNYNFIGINDKDNNIFRWGWDYFYNNVKNDNLIKNNTYYITKIINYILNLNSNNKINRKEIEKLIFNNDIKDMFLHYKYEINNPIHLDLLLAITLYITKSDLIYKITNIDENNTKYYILRNIKIL